MANIVSVRAQLVIDGTKQSRGWWSMMRDGVICAEEPLLLVVKGSSEAEIDGRLSNATARARLAFPEEALMPEPQPRDKSSIAILYRWEWTETGTYIKWKYEGGEWAPLGRVEYAGRRQLALYSLIEVRPDRILLRADGVRYITNAANNDSVKTKLASQSNAILCVGTEEAPTYLDAVRGMSGVQFIDAPELREGTATRLKPSARNTGLTVVATNAKAAGVRPNDKITMTYGGLFGRSMIEDAEEAHERRFMESEVVAAVLDGTRTTKAFLEQNEETLRDPARLIADIEVWTAFMRLTRADLLQPRARYLASTRVQVVDTGDDRSGLTVRTATAVKDSEIIFEQQANWADLVDADHEAGGIGGQMYIPELAAKITLDDEQQGPSHVYLMHGAPPDRATALVTYVHDPRQMAAGDRGQIKLVVRALRDLAAGEEITYDADTKDVNVTVLIRDVAMLISSGYRDAVLGMLGNDDATNTEFKRRWGSERNTRTRMSNLGLSQIGSGGGRWVIKNELTMNRTVRFTTRDGLERGLTAIRMSHAGGEEAAGGGS